MYFGNQPENMYLKKKKKRNLHREFGQVSGLRWKGQVARSAWGKLH